MARKAIVVAHPDDETLWAGGLLAMGAREWDVICVTRPRKDPERMKGFERACDVFDVKGFAILHPEEKLADWTPTDFARNVDLKPYEWVVTHNEKGEYGNSHHMMVNRLVKATFSGRIWHFGHNVEANHFVSCDGEAMRKKEEALQCYDHVSPTDNGVPKWEALKKRYPYAFQAIEPYLVPR